MTVRAQLHCHSQNSRRFECVCGRLHDWPRGKAAQRIECVCGSVHWRGRGREEMRRRGTKRCYGFGGGWK
jgi:hypothetical protein